MSAVAAFVKWQTDIGRNPRESEHISLESTLSGLAPLSMELRRAAFVPTESTWTAYFASGLLGSDQVALAPRRWDNRRMGLPQLRWFPAERLVPALLAFASVGAGVTACRGGERPTTRVVAAAPPPQLVTPTSAAASRSASASASALAVPVASGAPSASVSTLPSATAAEAQPLADPNVAAAPGFRPTTVYGAGPPLALGAGAPKPKATVSLGAVRVQGATVANAKRVVAGMGAGFRSCYQRGLAEDDKMAGALRLSLAVGPQGVVIDVDLKQTGQAISASVKDCIAWRAQAAQFDRPEGASSAQIEFTATLKVEPPKSQ